MMTDFTLNALFFMIIMFAFFTISDYFILPKVDPRVRRTIERRWIISTVIGFIVLYLLYGRAGPILIY